GSTPENENRLNHEERKVHEGKSFFVCFVYFVVYWFSTSALSASTCSMRFCRRMRCHISVIGTSRPHAGKFMPSAAPTPRVASSSNVPCAFCALGPMTAG